MKFQVERDALAEAVAWTARNLPARPPVPVLAGVLLEVDEQRLSVSGFDYEVSTHVDIDVQTDTSGRGLVSGRLLAEITRALPAYPVAARAAGSRLEITCGSSRFTLPTMPVEDYPVLPTMPETAGTVASDLFSSAVQQVAVAAGRDDTLPVMTGVRFEIDGEKLVMAATDRYRLAARELTWRPSAGDMSMACLVPARTLLETAKSMANATEVTLALLADGEGMIGFSGAGRQTTARLLDGQFPPINALWPKEITASAEVAVAPFVDAVKRVALVADRNRPVRIGFAEGELILEAGAGEEAQASENLEAVYQGEQMSVAFNPAYLLDGLNALDSDTAQLSFSTPTKPALLTGKDGNSDFRYLLMPVRLSG